MSAASSAGDLSSTRLTAPHSRTSFLTRPLRHDARVPSQMHSARRRAGEPCRLRRSAGLADGSSIMVAPVTVGAVSYTHLRAHETRHDLVCRLLLEKKK